MSLGHDGLFAVGAVILLLLTGLAMWVEARHKLRALAQSRAVALLMALSLVLLGQSTMVRSADPLTLPGGFEDILAVDGLLAPRAFTFAPDGRIFILERGSASSNDFNFASVRIFKDGALLPTRALTINTCGDAERGLLGIALDPDFATNNYIYLYYTRQAISGTTCGYNTYVNGNPLGPRNRISRFTMNGDVVVAGSEKVLIDNIVTDIGYHNAGDLHFGPDGYLYASTGEGGIPALSPDTSNMNGKILRILPTDANARGYLTTGNPFHSASGARYCGPMPLASGTGPCRENYAYGLRNPFRFNIIPSMPGIPGAGKAIVGDVGGGAWEEIDIIDSGANYGYPTREGPCSAGIVCSPPFTPSGFADPIYAYAHISVGANFDSAVIGGAFYTGSSGGAVSYPAEYINNYFFTDFARGFIRRLVYNSAASTWDAVTPDFATGGVAIVGLKTGLNGDLYYITFESDALRNSQIRRIRYVGSSNQAPTANISANPTSGPLNTAFEFSAAGSTDPDNNLPLSYNWNFGDGSSTTTSIPTVTHTYSTAGAKTVTLTVTDSGSPPATSLPASVSVYPGNTPPNGQIVLTNLTDSSRSNSFRAEDEFSYAVINATDDKPLPANPFTWEIVFHHQQHTHPFIPFVQGTSGQFAILSMGHTDPVIWYRVNLRITDSDGMVRLIQKDIFPETTTITLNTNPPNGEVIYEGGTFSAPLVLEQLIGLHIAIDTPSPQTFGSTPYNFVSWSHGGAKSQSISIPAVATTFTANFMAIIPKAPVNLQAAASSRSQIDLSWTHDTTDEDRIAIQRSPNGVTGWKNVGSVAINQTTFPNTGLTCNTTYYYRVRAYRTDDALYSDYSNVASATTSACPALSAPTVNTSALSRSSVQINWNNPNPGEVNAFYLERSDDGGTSWQRISSFASTTTSFVDNGRQCATNYRYRVQTYRVEDGAVSPYSPASSATTSACPTPVTNIVGLYRDSVWMFWQTNHSGSPVVTFSFGPAESGWLPVVGDWDGDGVDGIGLYRNGVWLLRNTTEAGTVDITAQFGPNESGWQPVAGDWNGDDVDGIGLYKNGVFLLRQTPSSGPAQQTFSFGPPESGWKPAAGDWNGSGSASVGVYKDGLWLLSNSVPARVDMPPVAFGPGQPGWLPVTGDWNEDGAATIAIYKDGQWQMRDSNTTGAPDVLFSASVSSGWLPVANYRGGVSGLMALAGPPVIETETPIPPPTVEAPTEEPTVEGPPPAEVTEETTAVPTDVPSETAIPTESPTAEPTLEPEATEVAEG